MAKEDFEIKQEVLKNKFEIDNVKNKLADNNKILHSISENIKILTERTIRFDEKITMFLTDISEIKKEIKEESEKTTSLEKKIIQNDQKLDNLSKIFYKASAVIITTVVIPLFFLLIKTYVIK